MLLQLPDTQSKPFPTDFWEKSGICWLFTGRGWLPLQDSPAPLGKHPLPTVPLGLTSDHEAPSSEIFSRGGSFRNLKENHDKLVKNLCDRRAASGNNSTKRSTGSMRVELLGTALQDSIPKGFFLSLAGNFPKGCFNPITHHQHCVLGALGE